MEELTDRLPFLYNNNLFKKMSVSLSHKNSVNSGIFESECLENENDNVFGED